MKELTSQSEEYNHKEWHSSSHLVETGSFPDSGKELIIHGLPIGPIYDDPEPSFTETQIKEAGSHLAPSDFVEFMRKLKKSKE